MMDITQEKWRESIAKDADAVIIDVRTPEEIEEGQLSNARIINILDPDNFMKEVAKLDSSKNYYIYCRLGNRSGQACAVLNAQGIENTYNLLGGMIEWEGELV
ncbi:MAG: rhodanese-like domain-containing protein [Flavobacteriaceae bacterium]|nr:rhodanese-like domain-containing protein [Flavobacteriaceae bacterium]